MEKFFGTGMSEQQKLEAAQWRAQKAKEDINDVFNAPINEELIEERKKENLC